MGKIKGTDTSLLGQAAVKAADKCLGQEDPGDATLAGGVGRPLQAGMGDPRGKLCLAKAERDTLAVA